MDQRMRVFDADRVSAKAGKPLKAYVFTVTNPFARRRIIAYWLDCPLALEPAHPPIQRPGGPIMPGNIEQGNLPRRDFARHGYSANS